MSYKWYCKFCEKLLAIDESWDLAEYCCIECMEKNTDRHKFSKYEFNWDTSEWIYLICGDKFKYIKDGDGYKEVEQK